MVRRSAGPDLMLKRFRFPMWRYAAIPLALVACAIQSDAARKSATAPKLREKPSFKFGQLDQIHSAALTHKVPINTDSTLGKAGSQAASLDKIGTASAPTATNASTPVQPKMAIQSRAMMQTPMGYIATAPLNGLTSGSYVIVHCDGAVTATTENGDVVWNHASLDFTRWTGRYPPYQNGNVVIFNPTVQLGVDAIDPFQQTGEHAFVTGDLTGDGIDDVAIAHFFPPGANAIVGVGGTLVSVLDGRTGNLVWSRMYPGYVNNLAIDNATLVVADESGDVQGAVGSQIGQNGSMSILEGWRFTNSGATATLAWSVSTGVQWARWLALEKLPNGKIAAAWTNSPSGSGDATRGHELVISLATGATDWSVATTNYPRRLRFDSTRNQIVAIEEVDPGVTYSYSIVARNLNDGTVTATIAEDSATATDFQIGDLNGDGQADYVVADVAYLPCTPVACAGVQNNGRILAINPTTGVQEWSQVRGPQFIDPNNPLVGTDIPRSYGLLIVPTANGADVVAGTFIPGGNMELERLNGALNLNGAGGAVLWSQSAPNLFLPFFISLYEKNGAHFVRTVASRPHYYGGGLSLIIDNLGDQLVLDGLTPYQMVRSFDADSGNLTSAVPLLGRIHAVAGTDVNGDGVADLIVGGESNGVFALDGTKIDDSPTVLWRASVAGPIHQIETADLNGDGHREIVVAATHAIDVLDAVTGTLRYEIPLATDYIWNFLLADLKRDGKIDIVVPGASALNAYAGPDGSLLWNYTPSGAQAAALFSNVAITTDNVVTAQFAYGSQNPLQRSGGGFSRGLVGINGATGGVLWSDASATSATLSWFPQFWNGTVAGHLDGITGSIAGYSWVGYDNSKDAGGVCDSCFTPAMEIRDAASGSIVSSLPQPWVYNGSMGTLLIPEKGILSYAGNASWLLTPSNSGKALGYDIPLEMVEGNFGPFGRRVVEAGYPWYVNIFPQDGIDITSWTAPVAHDASYWHAIAPTRIFLQDLDGDGTAEIIRAQFDYDGNSSLVAAIQGFGFEPKPYSDGLDILSVQTVPVLLNSVVSRKVHGSAGTFDVDVTNGGIECRSGGANGNYMLVFTFANPLASVGGATVTSGTGSIVTANIDGADNRNFVVNLSGITNAQTVTISLSNVEDTAGNLSATVSIPMSILVGDTNADRFTDAIDVSQTKSQSGKAVTNANFREDANVDGFIDAIDVSLIKSKSGTALP